MSLRSARMFLIVLLAALLGGVISAVLIKRVFPIHTDPRAALIEVIPPQSMQQSPAATDLVNRLIKKHMTLLQHPALMRQVMQNPDIKHARWMTEKSKSPDEKLLAAVRVRAIPDSNIIELTVDPTTAGDESAMLAEAVVNQHLENQKLLSQNKVLERSVMLNNLKQRYQFRKDELSRDLREKAVQLSVDGMGMPGRLSAKEIEVQKLIEQKFELEKKRAEASDKSAMEAQIKQVSERLDASKADLGALTNALNQYLTIKDDHAKTRELLAQVNQQLEEISQQGNLDNLDAQWLRHPSRI